MRVDETTVSKVKRDFLSRAISKSELIELYRKYNPDVDDYDKFVASAYEFFPKGCCGLASLYLREQMGGEIVQGFYNGEPHTFLQVGAEIVDITDDQFDGPEVYNGPLVSPWSTSSTKL